MRPLRLLLSLTSCIIALTLLLYLALSTRNPQQQLDSPARSKKGKLNALFSFTSPSSLFPPSAIISLTDDNSTFFLARPAAFGPLLPSKGLSGPLWIGSGFGDDTIGRGELGCSDVPGWDDGEDLPTDPAALGSVKQSKGSAKDRRANTATGWSKRTQSAGDLKSTRKHDGTDDYLHLRVSGASESKSSNEKPSEHADIQSIQEGAEITGKVVLLKRGGCGFLEKVKWAQKRGGVAVIVGDDVRGGALIRMYAHGDTSNITIPALFTSHTTAHLLSSLLPSGGTIQDLSPEDAAKLELIKNGKRTKNSKVKGKVGKMQPNGSHPTISKTAMRAIQTVGTSDKRRAAIQTSESLDDSAGSSWLRSLVHVFGTGNPGHMKAETDSRRPPSSGDIDWVRVKDWDDDHSGQQPIRTTTSIKSTATSALDNFVIGEQDWRDPDLLPHRTLAISKATHSPYPQKSSKNTEKDVNVIPGSGDYSQDGPSAGDTQRSQHVNEQGKGWFSGWLDNKDETLDIELHQPAEGETASPNSGSSTAQSKHDNTPDDPEQHDGLWVTLTPTNMSSSPFFDTLLVLVVSPLVTLTVVYALLLLRSRIRRRRWRAPKSVVERLPVRTYQTINDASPSPAASPASSSPTTPLLQHSPSPPTSSNSRPRSRTPTEVPATSSSFQQSSRTPEEEKREAGLAEWRRRYGGRQKECVVCLEEYVDGVSRVMSLPCGHEFHADCMFVNTLFNL